MGSNLCKVSRRLVSEDLEALVVLVGKPRVVCSNCGRVANRGSSVCKSLPLPCKKKKKKKKKLQQKKKDKPKKADELTSKGAKKAGKPKPSKARAKINKKKKADKKRG